MKQPTREDYLAFDGAHCHALWSSLGDDWRCPACRRTKFEILRWTKRRPSALQDPLRTPYMGWLAALHTHHDHSVDNFGFDGNGMFLPPLGPPRFESAVICDHCNTADGTAKRRLVLPPDWSFSPGEIRQFVTATPHAGHKIDFQMARDIYVTHVRDGSP
jgi:hypothetical protein